MRRSSKPPSGSALDAGLRLLSGRAHSRVELRRKLGRRGYDEPEVDAAVARLVELGYLDDRAFADGHVRRRAGSRGPRALAAELAARGVNREIAGQAVARLSAEAQLSAAVDFVRIQAGRRAPAGYKELLDWAGSKLVRRGFAPPIAREACRVVWRGTERDLDP